MNARFFPSLLFISVIAVGCGTGDEPIAPGFLSDPALQPAASDWAPEHSAVVFMSNRSGNAELYRIDPGDSTWVNLTNHPAEDNWPEPSPDGTRIAFHSTRNGNYDIFVMDADGANVQQLTDHEDIDFVPSWTPDGRIVFTSMRQEAQDSVRAHHVYLMDADGTNLERLALADGAAVTGARFSPDGRTIAFGRDLTGPERGADLYLASTDDLSGRLITGSDGLYGDPAFSPDGRWLAYFADHFGPSSLLVRDLATGAVDTALAAGSNYYPRWSPDGRWMLSCSETSHANLDVLYFPIDGSAPAHPLVASRKRDCEGRFVPPLTPPATP